MPSDDVILQAFFLSMGVLVLYFIAVCVREFGRFKPPALSAHPLERNSEYQAVFGKRTVRPVHGGGFYLTARQLEHINIHRRLHRRSPLCIEGFKAALDALPPGESPTDWFDYFFRYETVQLDHLSASVRVDEGLVVNTGEKHADI